MSAMTGVGTLTGREAATWWRTGRWRMQAAVWCAILGGLLAAMLWVLPAVIDAADGQPVTTTPAEAAIQFPDLAAVVIAVGVVMVSQGLILDERRNGVLEWLLSKPLARPAVIVAKFVGQGLWLVATVVVVPWILVHALLSIADGALWSVSRGLAVIGILALVVLFHLAFVLLLSTLTTSRVLILAIPIAAVVASDAVIGAIPELFHVLPWSLGSIASVVLADGVLVSGWPILTTACWTITALVAAAVVLERAEL